MKGTTTEIIQNHHRELRWDRKNKREIKRHVRWNEKVQHSSGRSFKKDHRENSEQAYSNG